MPTSAVQFLRTPEAIRERAENIFRAEREHFDVRLDKLPAVVEMVREVTRAAYPDGNIPIHGRFRHFGEARLALLGEALSGVDAAARARAEIDLVSRAFFSMRARGCFGATSSPGRARSSHARKD